MEEAPSFVNRYRKVKTNVVVLKMVEEEESRGPTSQAKGWFGRWRWLLGSMN